MLPSICRRSPLRRDSDILRTSSSLREAGTPVSANNELCQIGEGERFGQHLPDTDFGCSLEDLVGGVAGDQDADEARLARFQGSEGLQAIHARQAVIQYQQIGGETGDAFERGFTARHGSDLRRAPYKVVTHVLGENLLVFYDQYSCLR